MQFIKALGSIIIRFMYSTGKLLEFFVKSIYHTFTPPFYFKVTVRQIAEIGYYSIPVVALTALFSGMVLALQTYSGFVRFSAENAVATVVVISLTREIGPVFAGLMVAGRIGASISAEIGTMRVTEQIDALKSLSVNPYKYLIAPRVLAGFITLPILVFLADIIGVFGGYVIGIEKLGFHPSIYLQRTFQYLEPIDVISGLVKAAVFGVIVTVVGSYNGYYSKGGAKGVGSAATNAVVTASILILLFNYILTELFFTT